MGFPHLSSRSAFTMHVEAGHSAVPEEGPKDLRCPLCLYHTKYKRNMIDHIVLHRGNLPGLLFSRGQGWGRKGGSGSIRGKPSRKVAAALLPWSLVPHFISWQETTVITLVSPQGHSILPRGGFPPPGGRQRRWTLQRTLLRGCPAPGTFRF